MSVGPWQIILIIAIVLIFFGPKRIPGLGRSLGEAIRGFKKGISGSDEKDKKTEQLQNGLSSEEEVVVLNEEDKKN